MNAKTIIKYTFLYLWFILFVYCRSSADQPSEDYNLLAALDRKIINGFYWEGIGDFSRCSSASNNAINCLTYQENYKNFIKNREKNLYLILDSLQSNGTLMLEIANPDTYLPLKIEIPVQATITIGPETGNGYSRVLNLSNPNAVTKDGISIILKGFTADVLQDGLRGTVDLEITGSSDTLNIGLSYNIKKIY